MNERIKELAAQATLLNYVDNETPRVYFPYDLIEMEDIEKFAQLILQETIELTHDQITELVRKDLIDSFEACKKTAPENTNMLKALKRVIKYYSTPSQYNEFKEKYLND